MMKKSLILSFTFGVCISMNALATPVQCPDIKDSSEIKVKHGDWRLVLGPLKHYGQKIHFDSAWLYVRKAPAKCVYSDDNGNTLSFSDSKVSGHTNYKFATDDPHVTRTKDKKGHEAYHCTSSTNSVSDCKMDLIHED